uniref:TIR domain-containing protein n=1 Tax=Lotus japonicus TaxID=34305 RepID=I3T440_LOTJA|nr:unknown [Lotus japonicus]
MLNEGADAIDELSTTRTQRYDVFLSFCGEDSGSTFTGNIYNALRQKRIKTFFQPENDDGEPTSLSVDKAIQESRLIIVVFSEHYAVSASCLNELVKIVDVMIMNNQLVWPVYYGVEAPEIRHQRGRYGEAMAKFEERYEFERVQKWRNALFKVSGSKGWAYYQDVYEYEFIKKIVEKAIAIENHM